MIPIQKLSQVIKLPSKENSVVIPFAASIATWCCYPALNIPNNKQGIKAMITIFIVRFKSSAALM